ncbi:MAG: hypothetical protein AAGJ86_03110 [Pseudomonadota bacterium]
MTPELTLISINLILVLVSYLYIYPKYCGRNVGRMMTYDLLLSALALVIAANLFWGSQCAFHFFGWEVNWFWFSLMTYAILEIPAALIYAKIFDIEYLDD